MTYSINCRNNPPYCIWYNNLCETQNHIKQRCDEIKKKYIELQQTNDDNREKEYMKGKEPGLIFNQHYDNNLEIRQNHNHELISLVSETKSCIEKVLRGILKEYQLEAPKGNFISGSIEVLEKKKKIDTSDLIHQKLSLKILNKKRNDYEHESDILLYDKTVDETSKNIDDCFFFMTNFIQRIYESDNKS